MSLEKVIDKKNTSLFKRIDKKKVPEHIAIIMDGNGRWATKKGLPRSFGHKKGVDVLIEIIEASKNLGSKVGFTFSYFVFTTMLFLILSLLNKLHNLTYFHIMGITLLITITGLIIKRILR